MVSIARALALNPSLLLLMKPLKDWLPRGKSFYGGATSDQKIRSDDTLRGIECPNRIPSYRETYIVERGEIIFEGHPREILENERLLKLVGK